ncbi:MAG TPA: hypothetical protein VGR51_09810 [Thermoplasmata archaeon]|jgi:hypothetical protein|nr:hypothetical protein [Thermoplasmata archaeon]
MADMYMMGSLMIGVINAVLGTALLAVYAAIYGKTKSQFALALLIFAVAFLLQSLLVVYAYATMMPLLPAELSPYLFGIGVLEAGGLAAMVYTATR